MRHSRLMRAMGWLAAVLVLVWMLGVVPMVPAPVDRAQAGFFDKVKDKQASSSAPAAPAKDSSSAKQGDSGSGFFKDVKSKPPSSPAQPSPSPTAPAPQNKPGGNGGFFNPAGERPRPSPVITPALSRPTAPGGSYLPRQPGGGWQPGGVLEGAKSPPKYGWTSRGYFEELRREREARRHSDVHLYYWYYPYDYAYYCWNRYHYDPWYVWPYYYAYAYPSYFYYYVTPPVVIVNEPVDWGYGESYIPYVTWPSDGLMDARGDIEQAWRHERIELLDRHLDPDHTIASYFRDEYTHGLSSDEFIQLTLDAFSGIRTVSFDLSSARYVSTRYWARLKGKHVFYDPSDQRTEVYVSYLMRLIDTDGGRSRWVIWEVRQSPYPS